MFLTLFFSAILSCSAQNPTTEAPVPTAFPVPGVLHASHYERVRADSALGPALDPMIAVLSAEGPRADRAVAFTTAHDVAVDAWRAARARGEATSPPGPPLEGPGPEALLSDFDRVCTDVFRSWLRTEAATIAAESRSVEARAADIDALAIVGGSAMTWDTAAAGTAQVEIRLAARVLREGTP